MKIFMKKIIYMVLVLLVTNISAQELSGYLSLENRVFPENGLYNNQKHFAFSFSAKPELYYEIPNTSQSIIFTPFLRVDNIDENRTHFDIRELYWQTYTENLEIRIGIRQVFWGVTESSHLVDIINQSDLVEDLDGELKLGQPMVNLAWVNDWGTLDFFILPYFRERTFTGVDGRLRFPIEIDDGATLFENSDKEKHIDFAIRYVHTIGYVDLGLSYFRGTGREPMFAVSSEGNEMKMIPEYDIINQIGTDLQLTTEGWLWKLESIIRERNDNSFFAVTAGFEYTFSNINDTGLDVGVIAEYLFDDRDQQRFAPNPFDNHTFLGTRFAFNDIQSTELLAGIVFSNEGKGGFINVEGSRRFGDNFKLNLKLRGFINPSTDAFFYNFRKDGYSQLELEWYF